MLRESGFEYGSEAGKSNFKFPEEETNKVLEFESHEKPPEHAVDHIFDKLSPHHKSLEILKEAGYNSMSEALQTQDELKAKRDELAMGFGAKLKDRIFNQGAKVKEIIALEKEITLLSRKLRIAKITASREGVEESEVSDNVIRVPESVWHGSQEKTAEQVAMESELEALQNRKAEIMSYNNKGMRILTIGNTKDREHARSMNMSNVTEINKRIKELETSLGLNSPKEVNQEIVEPGEQKIDKAA